MGLDMYIHKKVHKYLNEETRMPIFDKFGRSDSYEIETMAGYWRKANSIHHYFVKNFGGGEDECQEMYITLDDLKELSTKCMNVLEKVFVGKNIAIVEDDGTKHDETVITIDWLKDNWNKNICQYTISENISEDEDAMEIIKENGITPVDGFFFGCTDIDCGYVYDLIKTVLMIEDIIANDDENEWANYYYQASW